MIEIDPATELEEIKKLLHLVLREMKELKRQRLPADPEDIEALLSALFVTFRDVPFTSAWALAESIEDDKDSKALLHAIENIIPSPTIRRLSTLLKRVTGTYTSYKLQLTDNHSRAGAMFRVTK